jgi:hypothetical protein
MMLCGVHGCCRCLTGRSFSGKRFLFSELAACVPLLAEQCALLSREFLPIFFALVVQLSNAGCCQRERRCASKADFYFSALDKSMHCVSDVLRFLYCVILKMRKLSNISRGF